jgi:cellulose synthase/poly-beta-1,6-N-acetylglucosamine synthase-like glycosyltransferase
LKLLFWTSAAFILYTYLGYPLLLWLQSRFAIKEIQKHLITPLVSVVMSALNEEGRIGARLDNLLSQRYPAEQLEILVVSDGSTDRTCEIVRSYAGRNVRLLELAERSGKALAVNLGVSEARGLIVIFADARQRFEPDVVSQLVANFKDASVGCVSGELMFLENTNSSIQVEMGAYWQYEKRIRKMESQSGSVVGVTGAIYAMRRALYKPLPTGTLLDDVLTPLNVIMQGYRCLFDGSAVAYDAVSKDTSEEWTRKVRTLAGNWQLLTLRPELALPVLNPLWWRFMSHKIFRLLVPFALVAMLVSGLLAGSGIYHFATLAQLLFYSISLAALLAPVVRRVRLVNLVYFFTVMNVAAMAGFWKWLTGKSGGSWKSACSRPGY